MTNWRERRLGVRARPWERPKRSSRETPEPSSAPAIIAVTLRREARDHAKQALEALAELMKNASSEHVKVAAANAILDRALGKPLSGARAADEAEAEEDGDEGPMVVRWLGSEKS